MTDEPHDPIKDLSATMDQYMTGYREVFVPMFRNINEMMKEADLEVEIRAEVIGRTHAQLIRTTTTGDRR